MTIEIITTGIHNKDTGDNTPQHIYFGSSRVRNIEINEKSTKVFIDSIEDLVNFDNLLDRRVWRNSHLERGYIEILHNLQGIESIDDNTNYKARISIIL